MNSESVWQNVVEKKTSRSKVPQSGTDHQKSHRDSLQSKLNQTLQLLKDEQKQQEGHHISSDAIDRT